MFKWIKKLIIKQVKKRITDEEINPLLDKFVKKYDSGLSDDEERKHMENLKKFLRPLLNNILDKWANS